MPNNIHDPDIAHRNRTIAGTFVVFAAIAIGLALFYFAPLPSGAPNSGSTSTSAEVDPATPVAPEGPKPGIDPDGK